MDELKSLHVDRTNTCTTTKAEDEDSALIKSTLAIPSNLLLSSQGGTSIVLLIYSAVYPL